MTIHVLSRFGVIAGILRMGVCLCAALAVACPGCGREDAVAREVVIRSSFWGMAQEARVWQELAAKFHASHPGIRVKLEHITGQNYQAKVLAMTAGRCAPDVLACDDEPFRQLADCGLYEDLTPYIARDAACHPSDFYRVFLQIFAINGRQYGLPYIGHCLLVYYNRDHRRAAGLSPDPKPDWTWENFDHDAVALTRDLDGDGRIDQFGLNRLSWYYCLGWVWSAGGTDMDPAMTRYVLDTPEAKRGFQFHYDHMHRLKVCPLESDLPNMSWESMFLTGKVSMFLTGSWWLVQCREAKGIDWDVAHVPRGPAGRATRATGEALAISPQSRHKAEAWEWIKYVVSDEGQVVFAKYGRGIPVVRRVARRTFPDPTTAQHEERFLEALDAYARPSHMHRRWLETDQVFNREWDRLSLGQITVDDFVRITLPEANAIVRGEE